MTQSSRRLSLLMMCAFVGTLFLGFGQAIVFGPPLPIFHDEFSYLLGAETFASGRLTNPPLEPSASFEAFHVLQRPTYSSKYPPGNALLLALGMKLSGDPITSVWLGSALATVAIVWCSWVLIGEAGALIVGILATFGIGLSYWSYSFWGGSLAAAGGSLLIAATHQCIIKKSSAYAAVAGVGAAILIITRPFEGLILSISLCAYFIFQMIRHSEYRPTLKETSKHAFCVLLPIIAALVFSAIHNHAVTGDSTKFPHVLYTESTIGLPMFFWQGFPPAPIYAAKNIEQFFMGEMKSLQITLDQMGTVELARAKLKSSLVSLYWCFPGWILAIAAIIFGWRQKNFSLFVTLLIAVLTGMSLANGVGSAHYTAPYAAALWGIVAIGVLQIDRFKLTKPIFRNGLKGLILAIIIATNIIDAIPRLARPWSNDQGRIEEMLAQRGGKHIVVVRYPPNWSLHVDWVHNGANISESAVLWVRDLGEEQNQKLFEKFQDRKYWLLELDLSKLSLKEI